MTGDPLVRAILPPSPAVPDQALRLRAAALIKAIADGEGADEEDAFDASLADDLARLLAPMPVQGSAVGVQTVVTRRRKGGANEAAGAGGAPATLPDDEDQSRFGWSAGERAFRCGAYVVEKLGPDAFDVRHVGDVDAFWNNDEVMRIERVDGEWRTALSRPRRRTFLFVSLTLQRMVPWRRGVRT